MELDCVSIGRRVKIARIRKGLTQDELADIVGASAQHISNIETGKVTFRLITLINIANALGVTADDLLCDNLHAARVQFEKDIHDLLDDCTNYEVQVISKMIAALKDAIRSGNNRPQEQVGGIVE